MLSRFWSRKGASGFFNEWYLIDEQELPRDGTHDHQQERSVLVSKLIDNRQGKQVQNGSRADLRDCRDHITNGLVLHLLQCTIHTGLENLYCNDANDTNDGAAQTIEEAGKELLGVR